LRGKYLKGKKGKIGRIRVTLKKGFNIRKKNRALKKLRKNGPII